LTLPFTYPVYRPHLNDKVREYVLDCIDTSWISSRGKYITAFEAAFAERVGTSHAIAVSNGTVALHLALEGLGIGPGDEVLVPDFTYIASANAVKYCRATPVFVDSERKWWQMDLEAARRKITSRTKAIMPVHLYGQACDMDAVRALAAEHGLLVVEDCAEAIGTTFAGAHVGSTSHVGCFSFFGNKTITTGEGGMVVTNDTQLANHLRKLRGQGLAAEREYFHDVVGFNYRMTNICAAIGLAQMEVLEPVLERKRAIARRYRAGFGNLPIEVQQDHPKAEQSYWMVTIMIDAALRDPLRRHLAAAGIETRPTFVPMHLMPMYQRDGEDFPVAEDLGARGINLPSYPDLSDEDVDTITAAVQAFYHEHAH
jgi:perosamine synthetase